MQYKHIHGWGKSSPRKARAYQMTLKSDAGIFRGLRMMPLWYR